MSTHVHLVGIGGIGMSALAQLYHVRGYAVSGSDRSRSPVTELLERVGIALHIGHDAAHVPAATELLVYSDAVPAENPERARARERGIPERSYFAALGEATAAGVSIVVSGTHGKTTTTAMLAKILIDAGKQPTVIAGSILTEQGSNFVAGKPDLFVIEGCEYRRHFLHLNPFVLTVNNIELDHTDYFRDLHDLEGAFGEMVRKVPSAGFVVADTASVAVRAALEGARATVVPYQDTSVPALAVPGAFNRANARTAKAAARALFPELAEDAVDRSLTAFRGTWRRFECKGRTSGGALVYDDYAHHPSAVRGTIEAARAEFPGAHLLVAFHPHLFSRTRDFMDEFAAALALADQVALAPIYAAREAPMPGVTSEALAAKVRSLGTSAAAYDSLDALRSVLSRDPALHTQEGLLLTMGAGDIYTVADSLASGCA